MIQYHTENDAWLTGRNARQRPMKQMKVLIGNYGSGKTELALNFAFRAAERGERTELLDLDMAAG